MTRAATESSRPSPLVSRMALRTPTSAARLSAPESLRRDAEARGDEQSAAEGDCEGQKESAAFHRCDPPTNVEDAVSGDSSAVYRGVRPPIDKR